MNKKKLKLRYKASHSEFKKFLKKKNRIVQICYSNGVVYDLDIFYYLIIKRTIRQDFYQKRYYFRFTLSNVRYNNNLLYLSF